MNYKIYTVFALLWSVPRTTPALPSRRCCSEREYVRVRACCPPAVVAPPATATYQT